MADFNAEFLSNTEEFDTEFESLAESFPVEFESVQTMQGPKGDNGDTGNGIDHATLNSDYTLTLVYDDETSDTVGPIRGEPGATGPTGPQGPQGETGTVDFCTLSVDMSTGILQIKHTESYAGPNFRLTDEGVLQFTADGSAS